MNFVLTLSNVQFSQRTPLVVGEKSGISTVLSFTWISDISWFYIKQLIYRCTKYNYIHFFASNSHYDNRGFPKLLSTRFTGHLEIIQNRYKVITSHVHLF